MNLYHHNVPSSRYKCVCSVGREVGDTFPDEHTIIKWTQQDLTYLTTFKKDCQEIGVERSKLWSFVKYQHYFSAQFLLESLVWLTSNKHGENPKVNGIVDPTSKEIPGKGSILWTFYTRSYHKSPDQGRGGGGTPIHEGSRELPQDLTIFKHFVQIFTLIFNLADPLFYCS